MRALNSICLYACVSLIYMLSSSINEVCIFNIKYVKKFTLMRLGMLSDMQHIQLYHMNTVFRFRTHNLAPHNSVKWIGLISCYEGLNQIVITCYGIVEIFGCFFIITVIFCTMLRCKIKNILSIRWQCIYGPLWMKNCYLSCVTPRTFQVLKKECVSRDLVIQYYFTHNSI